MKFAKNNRGILYLFVTIILFLFIIGFLAFIAWAIMSPIGETLTPIASNYHNASWPLNTPYNYAITFMSNFWIYLFALAFIGLALWVWMMSQHRGQPY